MAEPTTRSGPPGGWTPEWASRYWEARAQRFASVGGGLPAVCSYGMPRFYNAYIQATQRRALAPYLRLESGQTALDVGCGVGRWSLAMARRGALVTGVDLSRSMLEEASRSADEQGLSGRCRFLEADLAELELGERFDRVVIVTVLQHILEEERFHCATRALARHLAPGGLLVALEAAPDEGSDHCDTAVFRARGEAAYRRAFERAGLEVVALRGVDPAPWKTRFLPYYAALPSWLRVPALAAITAASAPVDLLTSPYRAAGSWHKVFVLRRSSDP